MNVKEDYMHMMLSILPILSISEVMRMIKGKKVVETPQATRGVSTFRAQLRRPWGEFPFIHR